MIAASWKARWEHIVPFLALPAELRRAVDTTNSIENLNRQIRKSIKNRGHFPDEQAATKLIYLAIQRSERKWRRAYHWTAALRGLRSTSATDSPTDNVPRQGIRMVWRVGSGALTGSEVVLSGSAR
jgi:transposase-like protein